MFFEQHDDNILKRVLEKLTDNQLIDRVCAVDERRRRIAVEILLQRHSELLQILDTSA
ncbi:MAG: hypothetical protein KAT71_05295 [Gammaproteobacteria bacterium]|nr:hypothetical protein [Gammaproteobacteria bacterium]